MLSDQFSPSASLIANPAESRWNHEAQATTSIQHLYANCSGLRAAVSAPQSSLSAPPQSSVRAVFGIHLQPASCQVSHRLGAIIIDVI